jgi:hypothetical protein
VRTTVYWLALWVMSGCAVDASSTDSVEQNAEVAPEVCVLAAGLPADNMCSLICDPDAMEAAMRARGDQVGRCYEFDCMMPDSSSVYVGVCLEPAQDAAHPSLPQYVGATAEPSS